MKKIYLSLLSAFALATCLTSCEIETSDNGDLDGNWHLTLIFCHCSTCICFGQFKLS